LAEPISIEGQMYLKRSPLGVLGLAVVTFGIYFFIWYYKINVELQQFEHDQTMSPTRSLMAMVFGWIIIVPPFIAMYNTALHVRSAEGRTGVLQQLEPALTIVFLLFISIANLVYIQEHLNRLWDRAAGGGQPMRPGAPPLPPMPVPPAG
jgi:Domain of unknown function (DUF4234)